MRTTSFGDKFLDREEVIGLLIDYFFNDKVTWWMKRLHLFGIPIVIVVGLIFGLFNYGGGGEMALVLAVPIALLVRFSYQGMSLLLSRIKRPFPKISAQTVKRIPCFSCSQKISSIAELVIAKVHNRPQPFHKDCHQEMWNNQNMRKAMRLDYGRTTLPEKSVDPLQVVEYFPQMGFTLFFLLFVVGTSWALNDFRMSYSLYGRTPFTAIFYLIISIVAVPIIGSIYHIIIARIKKIYMLLGHQ